MCDSGEMSGGPVKPFHVLLAETMTRRKITPEQLGEEIGRSRSQVYRYLEGKSKPPPPTVRKIALALQVSPATLMKPLLVEAAEAEASVLTRPSVEELMRRIAILEQELDQAGLQHGNAPFEVTNH